MNNASRFCLVLTMVTMTGSLAFAHLGAPAVRQIRFPDQTPEAMWMVIGNVGLLVPNGSGYRWLCDEAITTKPGFNDLAPLDAEGLIWAAATRYGLYRTLDGGCHFELVDGILSMHQVNAISPHPGVPGEALVFTETVTLEDDVFITTDSGATWQPAGLNLLWPVHSLLRAQAEPDRVYVVHRDAALRSDDGGRSFVNMNMSLGGEAVHYEAVRFLATAPEDSDHLFASIDGLPQSRLVRSQDGGATWSILGVFDEMPDTLLISQESNIMLLSFPYGGLKRSEDGGENWRAARILSDEQTLSCMFLGPDGTVWGCALRGNEFLVTSNDFGLSWRSHFTRDFSQVNGTWMCSPETSTAQACAEACDRSVEDCGGVSVPMADESEPDADVRDLEPTSAPPAVMAVNATMQTGGSSMAARAISNASGPEAANPSGAQGCHQAHKSSGQFILTTTVLAGLSLWRTRRRRWPYST